MENLKIRVNSREEQEIARDLLESIGYPKDFICTENEYPRFVIIQDGKSTGAGLLYDGGEEEITLPQLRDMVVLKRNDVKDATHEHKYDGDRYLNINEKWYWHDGNKWVLGGGAILGLLKPIEKEMKEYLDPKKNYELCLSHEDLTKEGMIEVPNGAEVATLDGKALYFWKPSENKTFVGDHWVACGANVCSFDDFTSDERVLVVWKRPTQNKEIEKAFNPVGLKFDSNKPRFSLLPKGAVNSVIDVLEFGTKKYKANNWQKVDNAKERYYNAAMRHIDSWWNGEKTDQETGIHHLAHAATNLFFLIWFDDQEH